jgi:hypothetical protein
MFAANVFTIIDSQDMQERHRLGPVAVTPGGASRAPTAWNGTLLRVSMSETRSRLATRVVKPASDGSAGAVTPRTMLPTCSGVTTVTRGPVPKSTTNCPPVRW